MILLTKIFLNIARLSLWAAKKLLKGKTMAQIDDLNTAITNTQTAVTAAQARAAASPQPLDLTTQIAAVNAIATAAAQIDPTPAAPAPQ